MGGVYHGAMPKMTPYGSFIIMALFPSSPHTGIYPVDVTILPATSLNCSIVLGTLKPELIAAVEPVSISMYSAHSLNLLFIMSLALSKMSRLTEGFVFAHAGKAA